jgi:uncharacterized membrane protein
MSSTSTPGRTDAATGGFRFGRIAPAQSGGWSVQWLLKRNCSMTPRHLMGLYAVLSGLSLGIAGLFWVQGATMIMPFAWVEVLALGVALMVYAAHAADCERIRLQGGTLTVEHACGRHVDRVEFRPDWVRVEPEHGDGSLIELSGQGHRIVVGRFVRPELRRELADELRWALRRGRWGTGQGPVFGAA